MCEVGVPVHRCVLKESDKSNYMIMIEECS